MSAAACKVIICGGPPRAVIDHITDVAQAVLNGDIPETDQMGKALQQALEALEGYNMALAVAYRDLMQAAFPPGRAES